MESKESIAAREALKAFEQTPRAAFATEATAQTPVWGILAIGLWGPAIVYAFAVSGFGRVLLPALLLIPTLVYLAVFNVRLRRRLRPQPTTVSGIREANKSVSPGGRKTARLVVAVGVAVWFVIGALAKSDITLWLVVPVAYLLMAANMFFTEASIQKMQRMAHPGAE